MNGIIESRTSRPVRLDRRKDRVDRVRRGGAELGRGRHAEGGRAQSRKVSCGGGIQVSMDMGVGQDVVGVFSASQEQ